MENCKCDSCKYGYKQTVHTLGCGEFSVTCCKILLQVLNRGTIEKCILWEPRSETYSSIDF